MTITVGTIGKIVESIAPVSLAESWDNPGLQIGAKDMAVTGVLTTLDVTEECVAQTIAKGYNLIVSHHPLFFKGIKRIDFQSAQGRLIQTLVQHNIAVYSAHTNLDVAKGGLNDSAAERLHLLDVKGLSETSRQPMFKVVVFVPETSSKELREALYATGAGRIGAYENCTFSVSGSGRFTPLEGANPAYGEVHQEEVVREERMEIQVPQSLLSNVLQVIESVHPYETPVYDIYTLAYAEEKEYIGRIGRLSTPVAENDFKEIVKNSFPKERVRFGGAHCKLIETIALCTGAGIEFMEVAKNAGAQAYVTGDVKYHDMQRARELGILVVDAGHFGTEYYVADCLTQIINNGLLALDEVATSHFDTSSIEVDKRIAVGVEAFTNAESFFFD